MNLALLQLNSSEDMVQMRQRIFSCRMAVLPAIIIGIFLLLTTATAAVADEDAFSSTFFEEPLIVEVGVFSPQEANTIILPFMQENAALFAGKTVLDIGTGSGIIGLYAAKLGAKKVVATDINPRAIENVTRNAQRMHFSSVIEARLVKKEHSGAFDVIGEDEKFDIIISNPPYLFDADTKIIGSATTDNGKFAFSIVKGLPQHLKADGYAFLLYRSLISQNIVRTLAKNEGLQVRAHRSNRITYSEMRTMLLDYTKRMEKELGVHLDNVDPLSDTAPIALPPPDKLPMLVDKYPSQHYYPGMIAISKKP